MLPKWQHALFGVKTRQNDDKSSNLAAMFLYQNNIHLFPATRLVIETNCTRSAK